jgi:hypothetical protein
MTAFGAASEADPSAAYVGNPVFPAFGSDRHVGSRRALTLRELHHTSLRFNAETQVDGP